MALSNLAEWNEEKTAAGSIQGTQRSLYYYGQPVPLERSGVPGNEILRLRKVPAFS